MNTALSFKLSSDRSDCGDMAVPAVRKLLSTAAVLPEGEYLGLQVTVGPGDVRDGVAFYSEGAGASAEDMAWIFETCADAGGDPADDADLKERFCGGGRKVYLLRESKAGEAALSKGENSRARNFEEFLKLVGDGEVGIRFLAGPDAGTGEACGMVMISLSEEITLRMHTMLSMAFPYLTIKPTDAVPERPEEGQKLSGGLALACMKDALPPLLHKNKKGEPRKSFFRTEDEFFDSGEFTPLEVLHLSPRSFHCLLRAGVRSVEKLNQLNDEDLERIRNLSGSCIGEIRERLAEHTEVQRLAEDSGSAGSDEKSSLGELEDLIGLEEVKQQVQRILALARMKQKMPKGAKVPIVLNMEFVGNPGTAKTTVARILAGVLADIGILSSHEMIEVSRADLVAGYVGQTAEQVKNVFERARGKLLFIDEAYAVADHENGRFGEEAINTLVLEMENNREDTIVVMAGYPDKMENFFSTNPGLRSRVPFKVTFPDYSVDELVQIARLEAGKRGFAISAEAESRVRSCCEAAAVSDNAGNGRFCRNLIEDSILNFAERVYGRDEIPAEADLSLAREDFKLPAVMQEEKPAEKIIGFRCS